MAEEGSGGRRSFILNLAKASVAVPKGKELRAAQAHLTHMLIAFPAFRGAVLAGLLPVCWGSRFKLGGAVLCEC